MAYQESGYDVLEDTRTYDDVLAKSLLYADVFVNKGYLANLNQFDVVQVDPASKSDDFVRFYRVTRLVYDTDENTNDKLISVYSALYNIGSSVVLLLQSDHECLDFYIGVRSEKNASTAEAILKKSLDGNFPGNSTQLIPKSEVTEILSTINESTRFGNSLNVASVSVVPSPRDDDKQKYVQGIEKFIDTMKGENYTALFIADPVSKEGLDLRKHGLLQIQSALTPFAATQLSYGVNDSVSIAKGMSKSVSESINHSLSDTTSTSDTRSVSYSSSSGFGFFGMTNSHGRSTSYSSGTSWAKGVSEGTTKTDGTTESDTNTETKGSSKQVTVTSENRDVKYTIDQIDKHLKRIQNCESFGMWDVACYFLSESIQTSVVAASSFKALMSGFDSGIEDSYVNVWNAQDQERTTEVLDSLRWCMNPEFVISENQDFFLTDSQNVSACSMLSGNELPYVLGLPRKSVKGITVMNIAPFGRNVMYSEQPPRGKKIRFGQVFHMGMDEGTRVNLDLQSFRSHCFITGSTGTGKSNTTYRILDEMILNKIPFLVIEPAKGEYKRYYGSLPGINIFCTNPKYFTMLHINPFRFHPDIHVLEHLDRLIGIFSACWPLYAAMPAILKESFEQAYVRCGWDLNKSIYTPTGRGRFPTFQDVLEILPEVINSSAYSAESKGNYIGSLVTRVRSLTNGIIGQVMCSPDDIDDSVLFDENTIVDLSRVSSLETKSLFMGILIMKLNEYRMCSSDENQPLRHVTVLEEAHNILKRSSGSSGGEDSADVQGKSVEMISASIAEMRTYGEGFIIVDQSPSAVDVSAIKNTNTKVIMRLPDYDDCLASGRSIGLNDEQIHEISRFPRGVAAVYQNNWVEAVLTKVDKSDEKYHREDAIVTSDEMAHLRARLAVLLVVQYETGEIENDGVQLDELRDAVDRSDINDAKKKEVYAKLAALVMYFEAERPTRYRFSKRLMVLMECEGLFDVLPLRFSGDYSGSTAITREKIEKDDRSAIIAWYKALYEAIDAYIAFDYQEDAMKKKVLHYLIYEKYIEGVQEKRENRYLLIYRTLYSK